MHEAVDDEVGQVRLGKRRADFDHEIARRSATGLMGSYAKEPKELAEDLKVWKVELEKKIASVETNETKMMERADQEAHQQNLWDRILRSTAAAVIATALARQRWRHWRLSPRVLATLSRVAVMTATDDGDDDLIVTSKPKSGDGLNVFVADLGNAGSYVKDLACYTGVASFEGLKNNDGIGVMNHDEVDDDDTTVPRRRGRRT